MVAAELEDLEHLPGHDEVAERVDGSAAVHAHVGPRGVGLVVTGPVAKKGRKKSDREMLLPCLSRKYNINLNYL